MKKFKSLIMQLFTLAHSRLHTGTLTPTHSTLTPTHWHTHAYTLVHSHLYTLLSHLHTGTLTPIHSVTHTHPHTLAHSHLDTLIRGGGSNSKLGGLARAR